MPKAWGEQDYFPPKTLHTAVMQHSIYQQCCVMITALVVPLMSVCNHAVIGKVDTSMKTSNVTALVCNNKMANAFKWFTSVAMQIVSMLNR